jgi:hypothetical protein
LTDTEKAPAKGALPRKVCGDQPQHPQLLLQPQPLLHPQLPKPLPQKQQSRMMIMMIHR